ncbi:BSD domain-containing protein 1, variant 2 [Balamuthia mandrillaris]
MEHTGEGPCPQEEAMNAPSSGAYPFDSHSEGAAAGAGGGWWGFLDKTLENVMRQSETLLTICKEDLQEFTKTLKEDTHGLVKRQLPLESSQLSQQFSEFSSTLSTFLSFSEEEEEEEDQDKDKEGESERGAEVNQDKTQEEGEEGYRLVANSHTFLEEPVEKEEFKAWCQQFSLSKKAVDVRLLLSARADLRKLYQEAVPRKVSHSAFWQRYYYHIQHSRTRHSSDIKEPAATKRNLVIKACSPGFAAQSEAASFRRMDDCQQFAVSTQRCIDDAAVEAVMPRPAHLAFSPSSQNRLQHSTTENHQVPRQGYAEDHLLAEDDWVHGYFCLLAYNSVACY